MVRFGLALCFWAVTAWGENAQLAGPLPALPAASPSFCHQYPCSQGCSQQVNCEDYDPRRDNCTNPSHVLVGWTCNNPCSCASDGTVMCSVSYRCVDMKAEMEELKRIQKPIIDLAQPSMRSVDLSADVPPESAIETAGPAH